MLHHPTLLETTNPNAEPVLSTSLEQQGQWISTKPEDLASVAIVNNPGQSGTVAKRRKPHKPLISSELERREERCIQRP